ncbi:substrate-binding periplasmic protein [Agarivorans sp.]|uniref:substrate-binding periplasmic protein n=1 Tax=Agarivorans sp. TaxID=1872412 RepID=UPI003D031F6A
MLRLVIDVGCWLNGRRLALLLALFSVGLSAEPLAPAKFATSIIKPWGYLEPELVEQGLLLRFARALSEEAGIAMSNQMLPYPRVIKEIASGESDFAIMFASPESEAIAVDLGRVVTVKVLALANAGEAPISSVKQLHGKRVGVMRGAAYGPEIDDNPNIERVSFNHIEQALKMLVLNRIEVLVATNYSIYYGLQALHIHANQVTPVYHLATRYGHLYWSKQSSQQQQAERLKQALLGLRQRGELQRMFMLEGALAKRD